MFALSRSTNSFAQNWSYAAWLWAVGTVRKEVDRTVNFGPPHTLAQSPGTFRSGNCDYFSFVLYKCVVWSVPAHVRQNSGFYASLQSPPMVPWFTRKMDERFEFSRAFQMRPLFYSSDTYHLISAHRRFNAFRFYRSTRTARAARLYPANRPNRFNAIQTRFSLRCGHHLLGTVYQ